MDEIRLEPYNPQWPGQFQTERVRLLDSLGTDCILQIEHFGSTAVPGLDAKPIIDILVAVPSVEAARPVFVPGLAALGYAFWEDNPRTDRLFFVKGLPPNGPRTHHVHVTEPNGEMWQRLVFRDYLRAHPDEANRYRDLKRELADLHPTDREAYTEGKTAYIAGVMEKAGCGV